MKKIDPAIALIALAAFLAPIWGGYIDVATEAAPPGMATLVTGLFSFQSSTFAHGLLDVLMLSAIAIALSRRQVLQLPQPRIVLALGAFLALMLLSIGLSAYKMVSLTTFAEWTLYGLAFVTVSATAGRWQGPRLICAAFVAGCVFVSLAGFLEYITQPDPTWRIMHFWQDPNALAGLLDLGLFAAIGLSFTLSRVKALLVLFAGGIIGTALLLTESKGGLVAAIAGFLCLFVAIGFYAREKAGVRLGALVLPFLIMIPLTPAVQAMQRSSAAPATSASPAPAGAPTPAPPAGPAPLSRLLNPSSTAEQSAAFRMNLWKGCFWLISRNPAGYGAGVYRFQSAKPGNTTETKLAHNSFLQLAVEINPAGAIVFVLFLLFCAFEMLRSSRRLPESQNLFRMGLFAACLASVVHNLLDSDFYFTGTALTFFILLGLGLVLSSDAILPELVNLPSKLTLGVGGTICTLILLYAGMVQLKLEWLRGEIALRSPDAVADAASLRDLCPFDYRIWYESVAVASSPEEGKQFALAAVDNGPTTADYHRLALTEVRQGMNDAAITTLNDSLKLDPNNLEAMILELQIQQQDNPTAAHATAEKMVAIEQTPYFSTRALPDVVPTETYQAREYLAQATEDPAEKVRLLRSAIQGFLNFANTTVPEMLRLAAAGANPYGPPSEAETKLKSAIESAKELADAYRALKDSGNAAWADAAERTLSESLDTVGKSLSSSK